MDWWDLAKWGALAVQVALDVLILARLSRLEWVLRWRALKR